MLKRSEAITEDRNVSAGLTKDEELVLEDSKSSVSDEEEEHYFEFHISKPHLNGKNQKASKFDIASCISTNEGISSKTIPGFESLEMDMAASDEIGVPLFA